MYRLGKKQRRAIMDQSGHEVALFAKGQEDLAEAVCMMLNAVTKLDKKEKPLELPTWKNIYDNYRLNYDSWIRVEDGLPEEGELILIKTTSNKDLITIGFLTPLKPKQWHVTERNIGIIPFGDVSHWMPLPKSPTP